MIDPDNDDHAVLDPVDHPVRAPASAEVSLEIETQPLAHAFRGLKQRSRDELDDRCRGELGESRQRSFSRCGETFCYIKIDGSEGLDEEKFADKAQIEDALDEVLRPDRLGCQIGGGSGLRYSYIDLALADLERGIDVVRKRLQKGNVPRRSWIQFFDADLAAEWVGIYDDSPPPPIELPEE